ncbi:hypothetical protein SGUI_2434 [Serinicoccus hydrothermalis]|uniref:Uncharacterized protein n=1 Tax=Serinicoccus hydrothermalis TaxID=1758689 RepID=A0A1B1NEI1_9MICO|nr:hypothetical protein [Serinicoccus hydrothermalis]ANS79830.1 hypothetical protein SGUI_2434 [Serinicoccus hydrothermalis]
MIRRRRTTLALAALTLTAALAGCGETDVDTGAATSSSSSEENGEETTEDGSTETVDEPIDKPTQTALPSSPGGESALPLGPVPDEVVQRDDVQAAIDAEAKRAGVESSAVTVAGYAAVTWSDGSIGCPREGMMYTQALVPGYQLVLEVDGTRASYHAAEGKNFSYCAQPVAPASTESGGTTTDR